MRLPLVNEYLLDSSNASFLYVFAGVKPQCVSLFPREDTQVQHHKCALSERKYQCRMQVRPSSLMNKVSPFKNASLLYSDFQGEYAQLQEIRSLVTAGSVQGQQ